jgi:hypothetical protein
MAQQPGDAPANALADAGTIPSGDLGEMLLFGAADDVLTAGD